jgi:hypothetical protein
VIGDSCCYASCSTRPRSPPTHTGAAAALRLRRRGHEVNFRRPLGIGGCERNFGGHLQSRPRSERRSSVKQKQPLETGSGPGYPLEMLLFVCDFAIELLEKLIDD